MKGMSENIRDALDLEYYEDLEHVDHGYKNVKPTDYINHLETEHCRCDEQAVKDCREHFFRGWQRSSRSSGTKTENLIKFAKRLDKEQALLSRDEIVIANEEKKTALPAAVLQTWCLPAHRPTGVKAETRARSNVRQCQDLLPSQGEEHERH